MKPALWAPPRRPAPLTDRTVRILDAAGNLRATLDPGPPGYICEMHRTKNCQWCAITSVGPARKTPIPKKA